MVECFVIDVDMTQLPIPPTSKAKFGFKWSQIEFGHFTSNVFALSCLLATLELREDGIFFWFC